jgi:CubicO group peptidase (beta-lactamase class C family)
VGEAAQISEFLSERIAAGDFPSAVYLVAEKGEIKFSGALGNAVVEPETIAATIDTIYDVASLTKPLVTALLIARVFGDKSGLRPFDSFFEQCRGISNTRALVHTSGLPAWKPFYLLAEPGDLLSYETKSKRVIELIAAERDSYEPGSKVVYSDLNYLLLGFLVEKLYEGKLDAIAKKEVFEPLGLKKTFFNPPAELKREIAASEHGNRYEKQTCVENGFDASKYSWREDVIWGEVHDGNAYFLDGVAGHAGLFSTAEEVFKIAGQFLAGRSQLLTPEICKVFQTDQTPGLNEARSLGFQLAATPDSTAGKALAKNSFGHLGFTGTSLWIEPDTERIFILLTNRTHDRPLPFVNINSTRREFHRLAAAELNKL